MKMQQLSNTVSRGMRRAVIAASLSCFEVDSKQNVKLDVIKMKKRLYGTSTTNVDILFFRNIQM